MSKQEFMEELEILLGELPKEERDEALRYYDAYFEEAGAENEQTVLAELGSAGRVAAQLLKDFRTEKKSGVYTETGYKEQEETKETLTHYSAERSEQQEATTDGSGIHIKKKGMSATTLILLVIVAVFAFPVWFPLVMSALGIVLAVILGLGGVTLGFGIAGIACILAGIVAFVAGIVKVITLPVVGFVFIAAALLVFGVGCLLLVLAGLCLKAVIWIFGGTLNFISRLLHGRKGATA